MRWIHFYPFPPVGDHGGTLRLRMAQLASAQLGEQSTFWFDAAKGGWRDDAAQTSDVGEITQPGLKRRVFPSTLYESGRSAIKAFLDADWSASVPSQANVVLHTTYLAPLLLGPRPAWMERAVIDVYDLVWRAHSIDSRLSSGPTGLARRLYSRSVRRREMRAIAGADAAAVAGYEDWSYVRGSSALNAWCPTGLISQPRRTAASNEPPVIGFLGNFAHQPTIDSARLLLTCPAAATGDVKIMLAGWESGRFASEFSDRAEILGPVESPADLWHRVDCAVIPVQTGAGMKCKISEALLAGCPVITTALGAEGFPPEVRRMMHVVENLSEVSSRLCRSIDKPDPASSTLKPLELEGAVEKYVQLLAAAAGTADRAMPRTA
jgi:hypothetical protein